MQAARHTRLERIVLGVDAVIVAALSRALTLADYLWLAIRGVQR
jgi:hypothetical protein